MVSVMSEDSELDLDLSLHVSDNEEEDNDGPGGELEETLLDSSEEQDTLEEGDYNEDVEESGEGIEGDGAEAQHTQASDDIEELLDAEIIVKADFHKKSDDAEENDLEDNDDSNLGSVGAGSEGKAAEEDGERRPKSAQNSPRAENKDDGDLLLVMDEKAADVDANEYEKSVLEHTESSKSPPSLNGNEESDDKTENEQPDDLMDIGDNIIDIGEQSTTAAAREDGDDDKASEQNVDNSLESMEVDEEGENVTNDNVTNDDLDNSDDVGEKADEIVENDEKEEDGDGEKATFVKLEGQRVTLDKNGVVKNFVRKRRGRPPGRRSLEGKDGDKSTAEVEEQAALPSDVDSNKENVQDKDKDDEMKETNCKTKGKSLQFGMTTRSLRKRGSVDAGELNDKTKKFKADASTEESVTSENTDAHEASVSSLDDEAQKAVEKEDESKKNNELRENEEENKVNDATEKGDCVDKIVEDTKVKNESIEDTREPKDVKVYCKLGKDVKQSFRKLIADKTLKGLSRETLEAFVVQKISEVLMYKSEVASLLKIVKTMEGTIDNVRKEIGSLKKQSRDLNIVNEKILQDLHRFKDNPSKPLRIPSITRSVGLQAGSHDSARKPALGSVIKPQVLPPLTKIAPRLPVTSVATPATQMQLVKVVPQQVAPKSIPALSGVTIQKAPKAVSPAKQASKATSPKVERKTPPTAAGATNAPAPVVENGGGAGVIDLTSDDEKKISHAPVATALQHVGKLISTPNGQKFVYQKQVLVKFPQGNYILNNSMQNSVLRTANPVNATIATPPASAKIASPQTPVASSPRTPAPTRARPVKTKHPAPLPITVQKPIHSFKPIPPRPTLTLRKTDCGSGILLSWNIKSSLDMFAEIASYQIYVYPETKDEPKTENWVKVGDVDALQLPIAVTLTEFAPNNRYFFAVRAVDVLTRVGPFSEYQTIAV